MATVRVKKKHRRQRRKRKLRFLRRQMAETRDPQRRQRLAAKIRRVSRRAPVPDV